MAVTKIIAKARGTRGAGTSKGNRRYGVRYLVVTDDLNDGPLAVQAALGISPFNIWAYGAESDPGARAKELSVERSGDDPYHWDVEIDFDSEVAEFPENPLDRPTLISYGFARYSKVVWKDVNGNPIVNSAGCYFDPPITADESRLVITMARNEPIFDPALAVEFQDAVNSDSFFGLAANTVKVNNITGNPQQENGQWFYAVVYEFEVRWDGWTENILDQGLMQRNGTWVTAFPITAKDTEGNKIPITEPVPLDGSGMPLTTTPTPANAVFRPFNIYRQAVFAALGLP